MNPVQRKIVNPNVRSIPLLDRQIKALEEDGNLNEVFETPEIELIGKVGTVEYLRTLRELRDSLADGGSEE